MFLVGLAALAFAATAAADTAGAASGPLWGRQFVAISIRGDGENKAPIAHPADLRVSFSRSKHDQWIGWGANCNGYGARVRIRGGELKLGPIVGTSKFCAGPAGREDFWLARFFEADPRWHLRGARLELRSGDRAMLLREKLD